jgi:hydroxypyruvate reductase/glycerate 2-kinase
LSKRLLKELYKVGVEAVMPKNFIAKSISLKGDTLHIVDKSYELSKYKRVFVLGSGKASINMAKSVMKLISKRVAKCVVVSNYYEECDDIEVVLSTHPILSQKSVDAATRLIEIFSSMQKDDLFIYLLSGGTSALIEKPIDGVTLEDFVKLSSLMLESGMDIKQMNVVRKSLSQIKGGGLSTYLKCDGIVLVLSDVVGDDLNTIGSAPLYCDESILRAEDILKEFSLWDRLDSNLKEALSKEVEKNDCKKVDHFIVASNKVALEAVSKRAEELNIRSQIVSDRVFGDVKDVAKKIAKSVSELEYDLLLFGGESTVKVAGMGKGGRNQELSLWVLKQMSEDLNFCFLSAGSDGIDGNSDAAGGVVEIDDLDESIDEYLKNNDSYHYLLKHNSLVKTGDSGTNVMDIMIALKE